MLITNGVIITWEEPNQILTGQAVYIRDGIISEVGSQEDLVERYPDAERLDAKGQFVMPGNTCAHTHFYGAFSRGMAIPGSAPKDFPEILDKLWWRLDKSLDLEEVRLSALVCLVDAIRHGTTALIDHHASPNAIDGSLDAVAEAVDKSGLRAILCYEVTDRDGEEKMKAGIRENLRFLDRVRREKPAGGRLAATFGLHASLTLSDSTLDRAREAAPEGVGFHIHAAESEADQYDSLAKTRMRVIDRLQKHGILGAKSIAAHAVHVDARETALLAETGTWVTHQPRSNMNNAVGVADVESLLRCGVNVCLGNDGFLNAMWQEWKDAYLVHKVWRRDPRRMSAADVAQMGVYNNARLFSAFFTTSRFGAIVPGAYADIILVDYDSPTPVTPENLPWHIVFGFHESMVTTTIVSGRVLMRNREILSLDADAIHAHARERARKVWGRFEGQFAG